MPAEPSTPRQKERYRRILRVAARLGSVVELDRVQMQDVAREAEVSLATLYRYFPSKVHLFAAVMRSQVGRLDEITTGSRTEQPSPAAVGDLLVGIGREMQSRPVLSLSMIHANDRSQAATGGDSQATDAIFKRIILRAAGIEEPTEDDARRVRLVMQCWYGALMSILNGASSVEVAEADVRRACELLLGGPPPQIKS